MAFTYPEGRKFTVKIALRPGISVRPLLEALSIFAKDSLFDKPRQRKIARK